MRMAITDLTRMSPGYVCAAGVDLETGARVRPVIRHEQLGVKLLYTRGGPLDIGSVVDLGRCWSCGSPPEVEDVRLDKRNLRFVSNMKGDDFMTLLRNSAEKSFDAFGPALVRDGSSLVTERGTGSRSLVILRAPERPTIGVNPNGKLRFKWLDGVWLSITDVRLYKEDLATSDEEKITSLQRAVRAANEVYLSFGLTRPFSKGDDGHYLHYLQLNNIHAPNWPDWRLCPER